MLIQNYGILQTTADTLPVATEVPTLKEGPTLRRSPSYSPKIDEQGFSRTPPKRIERSSLQWARLKVDEAISTLLYLSMLSVICTIAFAQTARRSLADRSRVVDEGNIPDEEVVPDECYYIRRWGYQVRTYEVITEDGYILRLYRIITKDNSKKRPVLLGHGLFQCSGDFILNEDKSMAFVLADQGYDVWLGNTRATASYDHVSLSYEDPEYWAWGIKELGIYDWAAMIDFIREETGFNKIGYIGHSQGNAMAFVGLKLRPELATKLSCFVALAPAVFSGTLVNKFPIRYLIGLNKRTYSVVFGSGAFIPIMAFAQRVCNPVLFAHMAYSMFAYLFSWWDTHWLRRRKTKYFQFTPRPVSSQLISDWMEGWGKRGVCLYIADASVPPPNSSATAARVPLTVFYGTEDYLVDGERLVQSFEGYETLGRVSPRDIPMRKATESRSGSGKSSLFPMLDLVHAQCIDGYEHMDTIWAYDNVVTTYPGIFTALSTARWT